MTRAKFRTFGSFLFLMFDRIDLVISAFVVHCHTIKMELQTREVLAIVPFNKAAE